MKNKKIVTYTLVLTLTSTYLNGMSHNKISEKIRTLLTKVNSSIGKLQSNIRSQLPQRRKSQKKPKNKDSKKSDDHSFKIIEEFSVKELNETLIKKDFKTYIAQPKNNEVEIYKIENRLLKLYYKYSHDVPVLCLSLSPDKKHIISGDNHGKIKIYNLEEQKLIFEYYCEPLDNFYTPAQLTFFSANSKCAFFGDTNGLMITFELEEKRIINKYKNNTIIFCASCSTNDQYIAFASSDNKVKISDIQEKKIISEYSHNDQINCLLFSPDIGQVASGDDEGIIKIYNLSKQKIIGQYSHPKKIICHLEYSLCSQYIISGDNCGTVKIYGLKEQKVLYEYKHNDKISIISFLKNTNLFMSFSQDGIAKIVATPFYNQPVPSDKENFCKRNNLCDLAIKIKEN